MRDFLRTSAHVCNLPIFKCLQLHCVYPCKYCAGKQLCNFSFFSVVLFFYFEAMITPGRQFKMTDKTMIMVRSAGHVVSLCASSNQRDLDHWVVLFF